MYILPLQPPRVTVIAGQMKSNFTVMALPGLKYQVVMDSGLTTVSVAFSA